MNKLLVLALSLPLAACMTGEDPIDEGGGGGGGGGGGNPPGEISGSITSSGTWSGTVTFKGPATIEQGVTITVMPGTTLAFGGSNSLTIKGTLDVQGTSAGKVNIKPQSGAYFGGINNQGTLKLNYAVQKGGGIYMTSGSNTTITDTLLSNVSGDFLVMSGGNLTMTYSQVGVPNDSTHCQLHFNDGTGSISITKSTIIGADYGFMFYGGDNGTYTNNNWLNAINVDHSRGSGNFSGSYFEGGAAPSGAGITFNNPASARLTDAGVRP